MNQEILSFMIDLEDEIHYKMKYIQELFAKIEKREQISAIAILEEEMGILKKLTDKYNKETNGKQVVKKEESATKTRYYLKDGSVYVVKDKHYRYLYDSQTKTITYQFEGGQVERTFPGGLKEIRRKDGTIVIKNGHMDFEHLF